MVITDAFDGGNIVVRSLRDDGAELAIRSDAGDEFRQWFNFRIYAASGRSLQLDIVNAGEASYPTGWQDYRAVYATDDEDWVRAPTRFENGTLSIELTVHSDLVEVAYFAPYSLARHEALVRRSLTGREVRHHRLGATLDGRSLDLLQLGQPAPHKRSVWLIGRQHPGETMAEWWMEGLLERLTDAHDPVSRSLLERAVCYVVPNMNPDGSARGHLRTNAAGVNLNREWRTPSMERSPEVYLVREQMQRTGVDICLDVHGDEGLPVNFLAGYHGIPDLEPAHIARFENFQRTLALLSPDFQTARGYPQTPPGAANLDICTSYLAHTFKALCMTLEMPFKDAENHPEPVRGWSPARSRHLARACVDALHQQLVVEAT